jgi:S1-C subfamily serine protease
VNALDLAVLALVATSIVGGYRLGLVVGGTSWILLLQGLVLATLALPVVVRALGGPDPGVRLMFGALIFVAAGYLAQRLGRILGDRYRRDLPLGAYLPFDKAAGAVVAPFAVLLALWLLVLPPLADVTGAPARLVRHSAVARIMDGLLPDPPDTSRALSRLAGPAASPQVFGGLLPSLDTGPPPAATDLPPEVTTRVAASTVKVEGIACYAERDGSGFAAGPDLIVTNAHVVAGQERTTIVRPDGVRLVGVPVVFDADRDVAVLRVPGLDLPALALTTGEVGMHVAVFGHPDGQDTLRVAPGAVRQQVTAVGRGLYDGSVVRRRVYVLAARLAPGDSGAAVVAGNGAVVGMTFAVAPDRATTAYALTTEEVVSALESGQSTEVDTGPCLP